MSVSNSIMIASTEIKMKLDESKPFEENIRIAMKEAQNHWLVVDEEDRFKSACGALLLIADDENKKRLEDELLGLRTISSMQSGVPVDLEAMMKQMDPKKFFGLTKIWRELKKPND